MKNAIRNMTIIAVAVTATLIASAQRTHVT
jgi:hypothetical protein